MMIQLYTVIDRKTGEELYRDRTSREIAGEIGVKPKQISAWAYGSSRKYIVTPKYSHSKKARRQAMRSEVSLEQISVLASVMGMSYGKFRQAVDAGEIVMEYRNGAVKAWKPEPKKRKRATLIVDYADGAWSARWE